MNVKKTLNSRYKIIDKIGAGGMAEVYCAEDTFLKRKVAVKVINLDSKIDNLNQERFLQEIKALARIRHPNVILIYDVFIDNLDWCLVLELIEGRTLKEYLNLNGILGVREAINIFKKILLGVAACHEIGIIHRDLKPDNIFIANDGAIKVLDFGISVIDNYEVKKHDNQVIGSMKYIDPEIVKLKKPSFVTDIYAIGIMLYEVLAGKAPFFHKNPQILANKHVNEQMPLVSNSNINVPKKLEQIILKSTSKNAIERYQTCKEMYEDLSTEISQSQKKNKLYIFENKNKYFLNDVSSKQKIIFMKKWFLPIFTFFIVIFFITVLVLLFLLI